MEEHQKAGQAELAEVENEVTEQAARSPAWSARLREYLTKLRQEAFLEIKSDWIDTGAAPGKDTAWVDPAQLKPETITKEEVAKQDQTQEAVCGAIPIPGTQTARRRSSSQ